MKQMIVLAGTLTLLSGCGLWHKPTPAPETLHYQCGTLPLTVTLDNAQQQVRFILDGKPLTLTQTVSASGARYSDGTYVFWSKGNGAFVERNDKIVINDCELQNADASAQ
ncbi:MliC family protein [Pantoea dispersa]|uniref:MliC family protein n=1 Tax=Pantoea dispersa TaxID=59814 RepID=UPI002DB60B5A|nr:MliC family protein [Pantoea dispersa]MEB5971121.1 MliC family protein [Pantoea dispersa]